MTSAKSTSRWISGFAWALVFFIPEILLSFLSGYPGFGLVLFFLAPVIMLLTIGLALYSLLNVRCGECGEGFSR